MARDWSAEEVDAIVADYFAMLAEELEGGKPRKTEHRRRLMRALDNRSEPSVERKHMNISAVLKALGQPFIDGYKPLPNAQKLLREVVAERLARDARVLQLTDRIAEETPAGNPAPDSVRPEEPPERRERGTRVQDSPAPRVGRFNDYVARDAVNRKLGRMGEEFIVKWEKARLSSLGRDDLAGRVEWTSVERGDGCGYDIASFTETGTTKLIEVKTTNYHKRFPFMISANEVRVSREEARRYELYRLFEFSRRSRFYILKGDVSLNCDLNPSIYKAER